MAPQDSPSVADCLPVYLDALYIDTVLNFDLYLKQQDTLVLYREKNLPFTESHRKALLDRQVNRLYVLSDARHDYQEYIEGSLGKIIVDENIPETSRARIIYDCSKGLVQDVFDSPRSGKNIVRSKKVVEHTVNHILGGRDAFVHMLQIASFDYHIYTHSVNVCTFAVALARRLHIESVALLHELGIGALLHDIGKSQVPPEIIKKRGSLTTAEYELIKKHPVWGATILRQTNLIPPKSYHPVLQHQERADGSGYPHGLKGAQIHLFGRIVAICDAFDAMTTKRVYKDAIDTFPALRELSDASGLFDDEILKEFILLMGPTEVKTAETKALSTQT